MMDIFFSSLSLNFLHLLPFCVMSTATTKRVYKTKGENEEKKEVEVVSVDLRYIYINENLSSIKIVFL